MNRRRKLLVAIGVGALTAPLGSFAQQPPGKIARIGRLSPASVSADTGNFEALQRGLKSLGWVEGRNVVMENRFADGRSDRLPELAAELVRLNVDVIVAGATSSALAAKSQTATIPIVMVMGGDPVASGLADSLARPGGNVTGVTALGQELSVKRLEILKETVPRLARVAILSNPTFPDSGPAVKGLQGAAQALGLQLQVVEVSDPARFEKAFAAISAGHAKALMVLPDGMFNARRGQIVEFAAKGRLPAMYGLVEFVDAGGLMFYGASLPDMYARAATYVDRILKGAKPSELPIERPTKFELVINMKTAKALGIAVPQTILLRADRVVE
jgi:putative ABC transport system substrate-binding protein